MQNRSQIIKIKLSSGRQHIREPIKLGLSAQEIQTWLRVMVVVFVVIGHAEMIMENKSTSAVNW